MNGQQPSAPRSPVPVTSPSGLPALTIDPRLGPGAAAVDPLSDDAKGRIRELGAQVIARYPRPRSAMMPLLYLVQAEQGYVSADGIALVADILQITTAEVAAVSTFYTMYKRRPCGEYTVGVCTNTLCAILGGDAIFESLKEHLGVENDETTPDGKVTLERVECNAACDYAPVVMVNWEFFDNQTPDSARQLVDELRAGTPPRPSRGAPLRTHTETARILAGFTDGAADEGPSAGSASLAGLELARQRGDSAPATEQPEGSA